MIYYLDLVGGNDSNDGTTFAKRWKTITSGATAARVNPGDTIRIMKTADPTSVGNATWTHFSPIVTLASAVTKTIDMCETVWTAGTADVTATASTTCREGNYSASLAIGAGFTTGVAGYKNTGTLDLSGYQQVSFWIRSSAAISTAGYLTLTLCSATNGVTPQNTITIPNIPIKDIWQLVTVDTAGALYSAVESVALNTTNDFGAATILIDNIIACKASASADSLTLSSLISKNTGDEPWFCIQSINDTLVFLDIGNQATITEVWSKPYMGTTETVTTYKREPFYNVPAATTTTALNAITDSGTDNSPITYSGGWDTTNMSSQTGDTFMCCPNNNGYGLDGIGSVRNNITCTKLHFLRYYAGYYVGGRNLRITGTTYCGCCTTVNIAIASRNGYIEKLISSGHYNTSNGAISCSWANNTIDNLITERSTGYGIKFESGTGWTIKNMLTRCNLVGVYLGMNSSMAAENKFYDSIIEYNATAGVYNAYSARNNYFINTIFNNATNYIFLSGHDYSQGYVYSQNHNRITNQNIQFSDGIIIVSLNGYGRYTNSGLAWRITATNNTRGILYPCKFPIAKISCVANQTITVSAYICREDDNSIVSLVCPGGQIAGVTSDVITYSTASAETWSQISISFLPTENGVVDIFVYAYGTEMNYQAGTFSLFDVTIDNLTIARS